MQKSILLLFIFQTIFNYSCVSQNSLLWLRVQKKTGSIFVSDCLSFRQKDKQYFPKYHIKIKQNNEIVLYKNRIIFNKKNFIEEKNELILELFKDSILFITPKKVTEYMPLNVKRKYSLLINLRNPNDYYYVFLGGKFLYPCYKRN